MRDGISVEGRDVEHEKGRENHENISIIHVPCQMELDQIPSKRQRYPRVEGPLTRRMTWRTQLVEYRNDRIVQIEDAVLIVVRDQRLVAEVYS